MVITIIKSLLHSAASFTKDNFRKYCEINKLKSSKSLKLRYFLEKKKCMTNTISSNKGEIKPEFNLELEKGCE